MEANTPQTIGTRTVRGVAWAYGSYAGGRLLVLLTTAILAHLLSPDEFGLVAIALAVIAILDRLADLGLTQALIVGDTETLERRAETAFIGALVVSTLLATALAASAGLISDFFSASDLTPVVVVLALTMPLRALGSTHYAIAQRRLDFRARTAAEIAEVAVRAAVGIPLAIAGAGVWSLVAGFLAGTAALTAVIWLRVDWRPRLRPHRADFRALGVFGAKLSILDVIATVISQIDYLIAGRVLGPVALGLYTLAFRLPELLIVNLSLVAGQVLYAGYASMQASELARAFILALRYTLLLALPIALGVAILAEPIILTLFGDQWGSAAPTMRILAAASLVLAIGVPGGTVLKSSNRAGLLIWLAVIRLGVLTAALVIFADRGIEAVAWCVLGTAIAGELTALGFAIKLIDVGIRSVLGAAGPALAASAITAPVLLLVASTIGSDPLAVALGGVAGAATYLLALRLVAPDSLTYASDKLRGSSPISSQS